MAQQTNSRTVSLSPPEPSRIAGLVPGIALAVVVMLLANFLSRGLGALILRMEGIDPTGKPSPVSAITLSIFIGLLLANIFSISQGFRSGLSFSIRKILRVGIILVGIKLSFGDVIQLGAIGVPIIATLIVVALLAANFLAPRFGVSRGLGTLTAAATAICGVTAAVAIAPVIEADDKEVAYTVANVTLFGIVAMFFYPYVAHRLFANSPASAGLFLGTAIHDTSQVMGAALSYKEIYGDDAAFRLATVTKLTRNLFIAVVVPLLAYLHARRANVERKEIRLARFFPLFVLGFLLMAIVRSAGDTALSRGYDVFGLWDASEWKAITILVGEKLSVYALGTAMAAVGLSTSFRVFRNLGLRPLYFGATMAILVALLGLGLAAIFGQMVPVG